MANSLQFGRTLSVQNFKSEVGVGTLQIIRNPNTGKLFFTSPDNSDISGAVSANWKDDPCFTWVTAPATADDPEESFWMLHKRGSGGNQNVVDTL